MLVDSFGRVHRSVRVSVTDRCNIRCFYCMPAGDIAFSPRSELLSFEEITRVVRILVGQGVHDVRLTGGEPLVRRDVVGLVRMLGEIPGIGDLAMTTNAILLPKFAQGLRDAGLRRLNISLDTLNEQVFKQISRRDGVDRVLAGIDAALNAGFEKIRLNALAIRGLSEAEIESLVEFAVSKRLTIRFIEYMPLDADRAWSDQQVLSGDEVLALIEAKFGPLQPVAPPAESQPSRDFELLGFPPMSDAKRPAVGVIRPVTAPFCGACDRLRLTAEGTIRNCLFSLDEWNVKKLLRGDATDEEILDCIRDAIAQKKAGHLINRPGFAQPDRPMYQIGG
jgi:cyclic pyranopterin phosphate synthase